MKEHLQRRPIIDERTPSARVPFYMLTKRERQVLQLTSEGLTVDEIGQRLRISKITVGEHRHKIGAIGDPENYHGYMLTNNYPRQAQMTILGLIQDGVSYGYIKHGLPNNSIRRLTRSEDRVLSGLLSGWSYQEIADAWSSSLKTIEAHLGNVYSKLGTKNNYHTAARVAYLKLHGLWQEPISGRQCRASFFER